MLRLNNVLLSTDGILSEFKKQLIDTPEKWLSSDSKNPSTLVRFKEKLKSIYFEKWIGCELKLTSVGEGEVDLETLSKKPPTLVKQGNHYFIYVFQGKAGNLIELERERVESQALPFPELGTEALDCAYNPQHQTLYDHIKAKNNQINLQIRPTDEQIIALLKDDKRFNSGYPRLKYVLDMLFKFSNQQSPAELIEIMKSTELKDWPSGINIHPEFEKREVQYGFFKGEADTTYTQTLFKKNRRSLWYDYCI